jgi:hypothetical protein
MKLKFLSPLLVLLILAGCVGQTRWEAAATEKNLALIKPGMSVQEVTTLLGNPRAREPVSANGKTYEIVRYQTRFTGDAVFIAPSDDDMTPFVFTDGKLIGWGKTYYQVFVERLKADIGR